MIRVEVNDHAVTSALRRLSNISKDMSPAMRAIGNALVANVSLGFVDGTDPWGRKWSPLSALTASRRKGGNGGQPLMDTGRLRGSITYKATKDGVVIGTNVKYATTHQFGAKQGQYGRTKRNGPIPWGNIPPRPFLPISGAQSALPEEWRNDIVTIVHDQIAKVLGR
jgi:phage virion morphogenesis protein